MPRPPTGAASAALFLLAVAAFSALAPARADTSDAATAAGVPPQWPLDPRGDVVHPFDLPGSPWDAGHRGVDVSGTAGQVVRASRGGTVSFAGSIGGKPVVVISHGTTRTTYEPVVATLKVGDSAPQGAPVGRLVVTHSHCFPAACLHWGLRQGKDYLDPLVGFAGPVRLLPLDGPPVAQAPAIPWAPVLQAWQPLAGAWRPSLDEGG